MQIPIISDIHGNMNFHSAVKDSAFIICLGDYVGTSGKNPDSNRCIDICKNLNGHFLIGNHDIEALQHTDEEIAFVKDGIEYGADFGVSKENKGWLKRTRKWVKSGIKDRNILFIHSYFKEGYFQYLDNTEIIYEFMETVKEQDIIFVGHTHVPEIYCLSGDNSLLKKPLSFNEWITFKNNGKYIVNAGSTGDPRDGKKVGTYIIFDTEKMAIQFCEISSMGKV